MGRSKLPGFVHPLFGAVRLGCKSDNLVQQTNAKEEKWSYPPQGVSPIRVEDQNSQFVYILIYNWGLVIGNQ